MLRTSLSLFCGLALTLATAGLHAVPELTANDAEVDFGTGEVVYRGNAYARDGDAYIWADVIGFNQQTQSIRAEGNVVFQNGPRRMLATKLTYSLETRHYTAANMRLGEPPVFMQGVAVTGDPDQIVFEQGLITYREPTSLSPNLRAHSITYRPEDRTVTLRGASLGVGNFGLLPIPARALPIDFHLLQYLEIEAGFSNFLGPHLAVGMQLPVSQALRLGGTIGLYGNRGVLVGPAATYEWQEGDKSMQGGLRTGFINDNGDKFTDRLGRPITDNRGFVTFNHRQSFNDRLDLRIVADYWSDSEVIRDYNEQRFERLQEPDNYLEAIYHGDNHFVSFFTRVAPNDFEIVHERLPELRVDVMPNELVAGIYQSFAFSAAALRDKPPAGGPTIRSDRVDAVYELTRPISPREWLTLQPVAGARMTYYDRATGGRDHYARALGEVGFDIEAIASGTFDYQNKQWGINGLRHLIVPRLSYRYIPEATKGRAYIPAIDRQFFGSYLEPLGLSDRRAIDELTATNTLRVSVQNILQTRHPEYGSRQLFSLETAADIHFDQGPGESSLGDIHNYLQVTPAPWISFEVYHRLDPHTGTQREINSGFTVHDGEQWSLSLANNYLENSLQQYSAVFDYRITETLGGIARVYYDQRENRFVEQTYGIRQTLQNLWILQYELSFFEGPRRESDFSFNVGVQLRAF